MGLRCIAPDCTGYGRSSSLDDLTSYTGKSLASDLHALATSHLGLTSIHLGGHDWGAWVAQRFYLWYPELIKSLFTICVPYSPPTAKYIPLELITKKFPSLTYQLEFAKENHLEAKLTSEAEIRSFLTAVYGGRGPNGEVGFIAEEGPQLHNFPILSPSALLSEREMEFYVREFTRNGLRGPLSYYRTRQLNHADEQALFRTSSSNSSIPPNIEIPYLFVLATEDVALRPEMAAGMERVCSDLRIEKVQAGHWVLWERPSEANGILRSWFEGKGFEVSSSSFVDKKGKL